MSNQSVADLERDVENARARLSQDLLILRSPATVSAFGDDLKHEAVRAKDQVIRNLQSRARGTALDFVEQLKAKAAANPAAALVIGAGLAWRLVRHPPIASVLVGAGLFSLLRTTPIRSAGPGDVDYLAEAKNNLRDQATGAVNELKERGSAVAADLQERAGAFAHEAKETAQSWSAAAREQVKSATAFGDRVASTDPAGDPDVKNNLLLGAAGVAVALALGLSYHRRLAEN